MRSVLSLLLCAAALLALAPPTRALTVFALVNTGEVYASADTATTWSIKSTLPVHDGIALVAGRSSQQLFVATRSGTLYRSIDGGTSWVARATLPASDVASLAIGPYDGVLLALTTSGSVYVASDTSN